MNNRPLITRSITGLSTLTSIQVHHMSSIEPPQPQQNGPPSLPCNPLGCASPSKAPMLLVKNLPLGTLRTCSCGYFYPNYHQYHEHRHPFPHGMINHYYNHSSMSLLFLPFVSMLSPRAYELAKKSEEERRTREQNEPGEEVEEEMKQPPRHV
jgi:hypothetical protein